MLSEFLNRLFRFLRSEQRPKRVLLSERVFAPCEHELRPILDERYLAMRAAMASGSVDEIAALLTPDFVSINIDGASVSAKQMIDSVRKLSIDRSKRTAVTTLVDIQALGTEAKVLQHYSMTSHADAPPSMPKYVQALSLDTWENAGGTWLHKRTETLETEVLSSTGRHRYRARIESGVAELRNFG
jgi:ketosteroid isomerase-like protein